MVLYLTFAVAKMKNKIVVAFFPLIPMAALDIRNGYQNSFFKELSRYSVWQVADITNPQKLALSQAKNVYKNAFNVWTKT